MNNENENEIEKEQTILKICEFFKLDYPSFNTLNLKEIIKKLCVIRLCKAIGLSGACEFKSDFFEFFSLLMGEAVCQKLKINLHIAIDDLRLIKYNRINLIEEIKMYLDTETLEEAFLDAFELADRYKYLIPELKKHSES